MGRAEATLSFGYAGHDEKACGAQPGRSSPYAFRATALRFVIFCCSIRVPFLSRPVSMPAQGRGEGR